MQNINPTALFLSEPDMAGGRVSVILMFLVVVQALAKRKSFKERIKEKMEERAERKEEKSEKTSVVGWRRKRSVQGTPSYVE